MKMRHELKYAINNADYHLLTSRLSMLLPTDTHAGAHGEYRVRSLYFDTLGDTALRDKTSGTNRREKFRLRLYNGDASFIRLEKKMKQNGLCAKTSVSVTKEQASRIIAGDIAWLCECEHPLLLELYSRMKNDLLRAKTVVEYARKPFLFPAGNVRVTLDRDIRTGLKNTGFLLPSLPLVNTFETYALIEIKYDHYLPDFITKIVQIGNRARTAFSKYAACRKYD